MLNDTIATDTGDIIGNAAAVAAVITIIIFGSV